MTSSKVRISTSDSASCARSSQLLNRWSLCTLSDNANLLASSSRHMAFNQSNQMNRPAASAMRASGRSAFLIFLIFILVPNVEQLPRRTRVRYAALLCLFHESQPNDLVRCNRSVLRWVIHVLLKVSFKKRYRVIKAFFLNGFSCFVFS